MPIIRSSRLYVCYYSLWCAMPWLLVVGGQMHDSRHSLLSCTWPPTDKHTSSHLQYNTSLNLCKGNVTVYPTKVCGRTRDRCSRTLSASQQWWMWVVTLMLYRLYLWGKIIWYRLSRTITGKKSRSGSFRDKGMLMQVIELRFRCRSGHGLVSKWKAVWRPCMKSCS